MSAVRVRFAPSPTGFLHIGGARTALFNWLFARHMGGKFFLRIEDTDQNRSTEEAVLAILDGMSWLGLTTDPYDGMAHVRQTDRMHRYQSAAERLLEIGRAYLCDCTSEDLEARRKQALAQGVPPRYDGRCRRRATPPPRASSVIRFSAMADSPMVVEDLIKGAVTFDPSTVEDFVLMRSDGTPTYNFCVVVDDADMQISHVIRGDDHLNNTPKQIQLYHALACPLPRFGHLPMILGADRTRLSKRHGSVAVQHYREAGYLPDAMINYLARLGWSYQDQEIFSRNELIEKFTLTAVGVSSAIFNPEKLLWVNAHHLRLFNPAELAVQAIPHLARLQISVASPHDLKPVVALLQERSRTLVELAESLTCFITETFPVEEKARQLLHENVPILKAVRIALTEIPFEKTALTSALKAVGEQQGLKLAQVAQPLRAALTGKTVSPGIFDVLEILGRATTLKRIDAWIHAVPE